MPSAAMRRQTSLIDLITKILDAKIDNDPGIYSRYDRLWSTIDPSLGDRYLVPTGDVDALSCALDCICKEHGLLIPSIECRDAGGFVWIGFRGDKDPKSRRYATIWTSVYKARYPVAGWEECLEKMKEETAAAVEKDCSSNEVASVGLRAPDSKIKGTRAAKATTLSSKQIPAKQRATASTIIAKRMRTHDIIGRSPTRPKETKEVVSAVDVKGGWIVLNVNVDEGDEWTKI